MNSGCLLMTKTKHRRKWLLKIEDMIGLWVVSILFPLELLFLGPDFKNSEVEKKKSQKQDHQNTQINFSCSFELLLSCGIQSSTYFIFKANLTMKSSYRVVYVVTVAYSLMRLEYWDRREHGKSWKNWII